MNWFLVKSLNELIRHSYLESIFEIESSTKTSFRIELTDKVKFHLNYQNCSRVTEDVIAHGVSSTKSMAMAVPPCGCSMNV